MTEPPDFTRALLRASGAATLAVAARRLARAGVPVCPCAPDGKQPITPHGFRDATTRVAEVEAWWSRTPEANLGVPTGGTSGMVVVDVDVHGRADGRIAFDRASRAGLVGGWALLVRTPSGGLHAFYAATPGVEQRSWQAAAAGVDFRGDGGYIIVPPSARVIDHVPTRYEVVSASADRAHLDAAELRELLDPRPEPATLRIGVEAQGADVARLAAWVAGRDEGERNRSVFWAACRLAENGVPASNALDVLTTAASQAGLSEREITTTVRSAYRLVPPAPRWPSRPDPPTGGERSAGWFERQRNPPPAACQRGRGM